MNIAGIAAPFAALLLLMAAACTPEGRPGSNTADGVAAQTIALTITSSNGVHRFTVEHARTEAEQARGLMFRVSIPADGGMLFSPHPPAGGAPAEANFWMRNTPSPLDIIFIRADGSIARIAENTTPFSDTQIPSGEPVSAVLELRGGRAAELGIAVDDKVTWAERARN